ncbi:MAG: universal stress protein [Halobacteriaceae archaeon]
MKRILVPLDESEQAWEALEFALSEFPNAEITVIRVIDPIEAGYSADATGFGVAEDWFDQAKASAQALFDDAQEVADRHGVDLERVVEVGRPARTIVDYADESADQIVMGSHGRSGVSRILLGSVAESVARRATVPVTIVR